MNEDWQPLAIAWLRSQREYALATRLSNAWSAEMDDRLRKGYVQPPAQSLEWAEPVCSRWPKCGCPHIYECIGNKNE